MTGASQFIKAITTTLEYKLPIAATITRLRMEYRYDDSTGSQGGFFKGGEVAPGDQGELVQRADHLPALLQPLEAHSLRGLQVPDAVVAA